jgi:hypothetical protein
MPETGRAASSVDVFVYYKVPMRKQQELRVAVERLFVMMRSLLRESACLSVRIESSDSTRPFETWMEHFPLQSDDWQHFVRLLGAAENACGLGMFIEGNRHVEVFRACA